MSTETIEVPTETTDRLAQLCSERVQGAHRLASSTFAGYDLPWLNLQRHTDTFLPGDLIIFAAYTGSGKTTVVQNLTDHWAKKGHSVLVFPTEQRPDAMTLKQGCMMSGIPLMDARRGRLDAHWKAKLDAAIALQGQAPYNRVSYYPSPEPTTTQVLKAIAAAAAKGVDIFVIDYLGRMDYSDIKTGSEWQQVKTFVRQLKNLAVKLNVLIVACAQMMKGEAAALAAHRKPDMGNIQGGQAVGMEADICLGIYQPLDKNATDLQLASVQKGYMDVEEVIMKATAAIILLKHREDGSRRGRHALFWVKHNRLVMRNPQDASMPEQLETSEYERDMIRKMDASLFSVAGLTAEFKDIQRSREAFDH